MKTIPTREQVLDALQTHKTVQKAAKALGVKYPEMQKYLKRYGIKTIPAAKLPPLLCKPAFEQKIEAPIVKLCTRKEIANRLFCAMKRFRNTSVSDLLSELRHIPSEEEMKKRSERAKKLYEESWQGK